MNKMFTAFDTAAASFLKRRAPARRKVDRRCPGCGYRYRDFRECSFLGCAGCYEVFAGRLRRHLTGMHGLLLHRGKFPAGFGGGKKRWQEIEYLQRGIIEALERKDYAAAAALGRDVEEVLFPR